MKCNINRTASNIGFANVFGPEFDKSPEEIINTIRKLIAIKVIDATFNPTYVEMALYNSDYYVRPADRTQFVMACKRTFDRLDEEHAKNYDAQYHLNWFLNAFGLVRTHFDEEYFEEQVKQRTSSKMISINKDQLRMYLKKLDRAKLESFLNMVIICRLEKGWFITNGSSTTFWAKIYDACRAAGVKVPYELDSIEGQRFLKNNRSFYFNALDTQVIANMLCDAIDLDIETATSAAEKLYNSGYEAMVNYLNRKILT